MSKPTGPGSKSGEQEWMDSSIAHCGNMVNEDEIDIVFIAHQTFDIGYVTADRCYYLQRGDAYLARASLEMGRGRTRKGRNT